VGYGVVGDGDDFVDVALNEGEGALGGTGDGDAVCDGAGRGCRHNAPGGEGAADAVHRGGLDADDADIRAPGLYRHRDPGKQPTAAGRYQHFGNVGDLVEQFEAESALPGDDRVVVERGHEDAALATGDGLCLGAGIIERGAVDDDAGAKCAGGVDLGEGRRLGHDNGDGNAAGRAGEGDPLGVVAGAHGDEASAGGGGIELADEVEGAADLEGAGELEVLALEQEGDVEPGGGHSERPDRRQADIRGEGAAGRGDGRKGDGVGLSGH